MTSETCVTVGLADFDRVSITCGVKNCRTQVSVPLASQQMAPARCPTCNTEYGDHVLNPLNELLRLLRQFSAQAFPVRLHVKEETRQS